MESLYDKISHLRKLANNVDIDQTTGEGKLMVAVIDYLEELTDAVNYLNNIKKDSTAFENIDSMNFICPHCNEAIDIDENIIDNQEFFTCPKCEGTIEISTNFD